MGPRTSGFYAVAVLAALGTWSACAPNPDSTKPPEAPRVRPNVLLVILDTLRADALGCYGCRVASSPQLDTVAARGVLFEEVLAPASWTRPSVGALLTSQYPRTLGLFVEEGNALPAEVVTLPEVLHEAGYATLGATANPNINSTYGFHQGFDAYRDCMVLFPWMKPREGAVVRGQAPLPSARAIFEEAKYLVAEAPKDRPIYLQLALMEAHEWTIRQRMPRMLRAEYADYFPEQEWSRYFQLVRQLTDDLGAFIRDLKAQPGWSDALIVFVSDHGEGLGDHPGVPNGRHHGRLLYESQVRVPWIMQRDGWQPALARVAHPTRLLDVMPTLLDALDLPTPPGIIGHSMMPLLRGDTAEIAVPQVRVCETNFMGADRIAAYSKEWIYVRAPREEPGLGREELQARFQAQDGVRTNALAREPQTAAALEAFLKQWELKYKKRTESAMARELTADESNLLRSIGY